MLTTHPPMTNGVTVYIYIYTYRMDLGFWAKAFTCFLNLAFAKWRAGRGIGRPGGFVVQGCLGFNSSKWLSDVRGRFRVGSAFLGRRVQDFEFCFRVTTRSGPDIFFELVKLRSQAVA